MVLDKSPVFLKPDYDLADISFDTVLDTTCERLWERYVRHSIRRIKEMEEELKGFEKELDEFIARVNHG